MLTVLGIAIALGSKAGVAVTLGLGIPVYLYRIAIEEGALLAQLGDAYRRYRSRTWRLVPFVY
jgi:protein-S-isoprenylcysteine O-methyltransferase Ste14